MKLRALDSYPHHPRLQKFLQYEERMLNSNQLHQPNRRSNSVENYTSRRCYRPRRYSHRTHPPHQPQRQTYGRQRQSGDVPLMQGALPYCRRQQHLFRQRHSCSSGRNEDHLQRNPDRQRLPRCRSPLTDTALFNKCTPPIGLITPMPGINPRRRRPSAHLHRRPGER